MIKDKIPSICPICKIHLTIENINWISPLEIECKSCRYVISLADEFNFVDENMS